MNSSFVPKCPSPDILPFTPVTDVFFASKIEEHSASSSDLITNKICHNMNFKQNQQHQLVSIVNVTQLLSQLSTQQTAGACIIVLFYATWCPFSMRISPAYNALGRLIPGIPLYAVEIARQVNTLASNQLRFGAVSVPNLFVFQGTKTVARLNSTNADIDSLIHFLKDYMNLPSHVLNHSRNSSCHGEEDVNIATQCNITGHELTEADFHGPLPTQLTEQFNWVLLLSWIFIFYMLFQKLKPTIRNIPDHPDD